MSVDLDYCLLKWAVNGSHNQCGDTGLVRMVEGDCFLALVDVLGHGADAHNVAVSAERFLEENHPTGLVELMDGLHKCLKGTRGAVAALCRLEPAGGVLRYVGVGNINVRIYGVKPYHFVPRDGIVGYMISSLHEQMIRLTRGDILIMSSDGIKEHFSLEAYPGLLIGPAAEIAANFMKWLSKGDDDASCIALRYGV